MPALAQELCASHCFGGESLARAGEAEASGASHAESRPAISWRLTPLALAGEAASQAGHNKKFACTLTAFGQSEVLEILTMRFSQTFALTGQAWAGLALNMAWLGYAELAGGADSQAALPRLIPSGEQGWKGLASAEAAGLHRLALRMETLGDGRTILTGLTFVQGMGLPIRIEKPRDGQGLIRIKVQAVDYPLILTRNKK